MDNKIFSENSKLFKLWFLITLLPPLILLSVLLINGIGKGSVSDIILSAVFLLINVLVMIILLLHKLTVEIDKEGVKIKYLPYFRKLKIFEWDRIKSIDIISYDPIHDFGGWGLKKSKLYGQGYTTTGNLGLHIVLNDTKSYMLSIFNKENALKAIETYQPMK